MCFSIDGSCEKWEAVVNAACIYVLCLCLTLKPCLPAVLPRDELTRRLPLLTEGVCDQNKFSMFQSADAAGTSFIKRSIKNSPVLASITLPPTSCPVL